LSKRSQPRQSQQQKLERPKVASANEINKIISNIKRERKKGRKTNKTKATMYLVSTSYHLIKSQSPTLTVYPKLRQEARDNILAKPVISNTSHILQTRKAMVNPPKPLQMITPSGLERPRNGEGSPISPKISNTIQQLRKLA